MSIIIWVIAAFLGQLARKESAVFPVKLTILVLSSHFFLYPTQHTKRISVRWGSSEIFVTVRIINLFEFQLPTLLTKSPRESGI